MLPASASLQNGLSTLAEAAITRTLTHGGRRVGRPTGEVAAVKSLLLDAMPRVAALWRRVLRPLYKIGLTSIFCHSHPQVTFTRPNGRSGRCELADLLIVIDHFGPGSIRERRATLVQAKVLKRPSMRLSQKEQVQFDLLSAWPDFDFVDAARYDVLRTRDFRGPVPPLPALSGEYGWIALSRTPRTWDQYLTVPGRGFSGRAPLGTFLAHMACGAGSCGREAVLNGSDDWSWTVQELIDVTGALPILEAVPGQLRGLHRAIGFAVAEADAVRTAASLSAAAAPRGKKGHGHGRFGGGDGGDWGEADDEWPSGPISVLHVRLVHIEANPDA